VLDNLKRHAIQAVLGGVVLAYFLAHAGGVLQAPFIDRLEHIAYDTRLVFMMPGGVDPNIVIVDVDEKSLQAEGRWPWGRDKLARMLEAMFDDYGAGLAGFDVVFAEPDDSSGLKMLRALAESELRDVTQFQDVLSKLAPSLDNDQLFADALARYPIVLGYYFSQEAAENALVSGALPAPSVSSDVFARRSIPFFKATGYGANIGSLQAAATNAGHFTPVVDDDGVVRRVPMLYQYNGEYYASLSLTMARLALNAKGLVPGFPPDSQPGGVYQGMEWIDVGDRRIPIDENTSVLVPYRGPQGSFPYVSATDLLNGRVPKEILRNKIVLVGTSAPGLLDLRSTPVQKSYAGVEVHANIIAGILRGTLLEDPAYTLGAELVGLALFGLTLALALPIVSPLIGTVLTVASLAIFTAANLWFWASGNLVIALAPGLLMMLALYLLNMSYGFFVESRGKRQLAGLFGQYIPPELVDEMSVNPTQYSMDAASQDMSVLFTDVRGFTTISEGLDPKELSELMSEFLTPMTEIIHRHRGTIDKYMGDAVMCFWGAPVKDPEHARHALEAAIEMAATVRGLEPLFAENGWPPIRVGIGINSGIMSVGDMGSRFRRAYTVLGDAVNLGSRLEGQTKNYGVDLIVNETTREAVPDFVFRELDRIQVKGKDVPVTIFEPVGSQDSVGSDELDELKLYRQALKQYRAQAWDSAEMQFVNLRSAHPDRYLYEMYIDRIGAYRADPPGETWDGVFIHTSK
jgi:adenylate cyclase